MTLLGTLSGPAPEAGAVLLALLTALALVASGRRLRARVTALALLLAPVLLLGEVWNSPQLAPVHRHLAVAVAAGALALAGVLVLACLLRRFDAALPVLAMAMLPFRVPLAVGGNSFNLLVPLYLVIAGGAVAGLGRDLLSGAADSAAGPPPAPGPASTGEPEPGREGAPGLGAAPGGETALISFRAAPVEWLLGAYLILYALQSTYSSDFQKALQQLVFFYVPFALLFLQLRRVRWSRPLVARCLAAVAALSVVFSAIGFVEYATKTLLLNPKLVTSNEVHTYFTVNSVFFDPDIFGRFLALVMICLATALLYAARPRRRLLCVAVLAVLWSCLVLTLSRSSLAALLLGLGVVAALRWRPRPVIVLAVVVVAAGAVAVAVSPRTFGLNQGLNGASAGRAGLVSAGLRLFARRPLQGYGSASFVSQYRRTNPTTPSSLAASHTIAITVAAEQGLLGLLVYLPLIGAATVVLLRRARRDPARVAVAAAFVALVFHSELYADFLEDPVTWALLGLGVALARQARAQNGAVYAPLLPPSTRSVEAVT